MYNWLCDLEWNQPIGEVDAFGGDVLISVRAFKSVGGYRDDVIAAEDNELSVRLRAAGWRIRRLEAEMTTHDAAILRFSQWWRRVIRSGYGFALGVHLHGKKPERHFVWESRRAWLWGLLLPLTCTGISIAFWPFGVMALLIYLLQFSRQMIRNSGTISERAILALFQMLARFPEVIGQINFLQDYLLTRERTLIEYK